VQPLSAPKVAIPRQLYERGLEGYVVVRYTVSARGGVVDPVVVESEPGAFDEIALAAVRGQRFQPKTVDGVAVAAQRIEVFPFCNPRVQRRARDRPEVCRGPRNRSAFFEAVWKRYGAPSGEPEAEAGEAPGADAAQGVNAGTPEATPVAPR
jgi:TonB family protein